MAPGISHPRFQQRLTAAVFVLSTAAIFAPSIAEAVDVVNRDKVPREIVINGSNGESTVTTVPPQQTLAAICATCIVLSGTTSVEAEGNVVVVIDNGKVSVKKKK